MIVELTLAFPVSSDNDALLRPQTTKIVWQSLCRVHEALEQEPRLRASGCVRVQVAMFAAVEGLANAPPAQKPCLMIRSP